MHLPTPLLFLFNDICTFGTIGFVCLSMRHRQTPYYIYEGVDTLSRLLSR